MTNRSCKLVLFDLDGVIIDSRRNMEVSWSAVRVAFGLDMPFDRYFAAVGLPFGEIMRQLGLADLADPIKRVYDVTSSCRLDLVTSYPGCVDTLQSLRTAGVRTGIVTSKDEKRTLEIIKKLDLLFDVVECPDDYARGKPNPDPLLRAVLACQLDPSEAVYVGDMATDQEAARRAGVTYLHATWGYGQCCDASCRLREPAEILARILQSAQQTVTPLSNEPG